MTEQPKIITKAPVSPAVTVAPDDRLSKNRSLYDAGAGEIFFKNFLAGFARGLGNVLVYLLFLALMGYIFVQTVLPQIQPLINQYTKALESINTLSSPGTQQDSSAQFDLQKIIDQNVQRYMEKTPTGSTTP